MNEESLEPITARLGIDLAEKGVLGFLFSLFFCAVLGENGVLFPICMMQLHHWHSGVVFWFLRRSEDGLPTVGGNFYPFDLLCLGTGEGTGLEARQSSCYCSSWQQSGWVIYMFNHTKSAENYLAEFRWPNNVSVCIAQHFLFIPFPTV